MGTLLKLTFSERLGKWKNYYFRSTFASIIIIFHELLFFFFYWLIDWLLCWVFVSVLGLSLAAASGGHSSSRCAGLSLSWPPPLRSTGSRRAGPAVVAHRPSRSAAYGILPDQGSNPRPLHQQADSQRLCHQGSPHYLSLNHFGEILDFIYVNYLRKQSTKTPKSLSKHSHSLHKGTFIPRSLHLCFVTPVIAYYFYPLPLWFGRFDINQHSFISIFCRLGRFLMGYSWQYYFTKWKNL